MTVIRLNKHTDKFVVLDKTFLEDSNISLKLKGFLAYCLSKPDDWQFHITQLITVLKEGRDALYSCIEEGIQAGYIKRITKKNEKGQFIATDYIVSEIPNKNTDTTSGKPISGDPLRENPLVENQHILSNDTNKKEGTFNVASDPKPKRYKTENRVIPDFLKKYDYALPTDEQQKLVNQFGDGILYEAIQDALSFDKKIENIKNLAAWLTARCKKILNKEPKK